MRIPNALQNILGEGTLSASFIPVYAGLMARHEDRESGAVAGAIASLLGLTTTVLAALGILITPWLIFIIAPGFQHDARRDLCIALVRILFPSTAILVWSAWCLAILNSHRKFFIGYAAPVLWNAVMIGTLVAFGPRSNMPRLAVLTAWAAVGGSLVQFLAQLPIVLRLVPHLRFAFGWTNAVKRVIHNFGPVFTSRGVVQISAYLDSIIASLLTPGSVAALGYAQTLSLLPVSLFGMSISTAELTEMSHLVGVERDVSSELRSRLEPRLRQIAFLVVPSAVAFLVFGDVIAAVYRSGRFTQADAIFVWRILGGSAVGLLASTMSRLFSSTFYALGDTRTPFRLAVLRVTLTGVLGYMCAIWLVPAFGLDPHWGVPALTASAGFSGWLEFALLRRALVRQIGAFHVPVRLMAQFWSAAALGCGFGWLVRFVTRGIHPAVAAIGILGVFGLVYFAALYAVGNENARSLLGRAMRMARLS